MEVKTVPSMGWTRKSAAVSVLLAMENHRKEAGQRLVRLREAQGWNQEDLAHHSGLSVKTISRFENGRHDGRRSTIRNLTEALGVTERELLGPPPDPLGLGAESQLDRIEAKLDQLLLATLSPDEDDAIDAAAAVEDAEHAAERSASARQSAQRRRATDPAPSSSPKRSGRSQRRPAPGG
jgi:transcriptional regulator with XRE-family HTH domain